MDNQPDSIIAIDESILTELASEGPDYIPLIASRIGAHLSVVENRCEVLQEHGLIEQATEEAIFQITEQGKQYQESETRE